MKRHIGLAWSDTGLTLVAVQDGAIRNLWSAHQPDESVETLAGALKAYIRARGLSGARTTFNIPAEQSQFHFANLPDVGRDERPEIAKFKLKSKIENIEQYALSVAPIAQHGDHEVRSLVFVAPREVVEARRKWVEQAGLEPIGCEIEAQSLVRIAANDPESTGSLFDDLSMTLIDIGFTRTRFVVLQNQNLQFVRTVKFGLNRVADEIAESVGISREQALRLLDNPGAFLDDNLMLRCTDGLDWYAVPVADALESLLKELKRLTTYFRSMNRNRSHSGLLERMILSGELGHVGGFAPTIGRKLGVQVRTLNPLRGRHLVLDEGEFHHASGLSSRFTLAYGLATAPYAASPDQEWNGHERRTPQPTSAAA